MKNYKSKRIQELKDFSAHVKSRPCSAPVIKMITNIEHVHDYLLRGSFIPANWVDDSKLTEFEIVPIDEKGAFIKRGYPNIQFHIASWETMQPTIAFYLTSIPESEYHHVEAVAFHSSFKVLNTRLPHVVMVEFVPDL